MVGTGKVTSSELSVSCIQGKIKGYLSHEKQTLIVSKADPFPKGAVVKR